VDAAGLERNKKNLKDQMECALEILTKDAVSKFPESRLLMEGSHGRRSLASFNPEWFPKVLYAFDTTSDCPQGTNCTIITFRTFVFAEESDDPERLKDFVLDALEEDAKDGTFQSHILSEKCKNAR